MIENIVGQTIEEAGTAKVFFRVAAAPADYEIINDIRYKVFVNEDGYPPDKIPVNPKDYNLIGYREGKPEGVISVSVGPAKMLPLGSIVGWGDKIVVEIHKLAILPEARKSMVSLGLMVLAYEYAKNQANDVLSFCLVQKDYHIKTCQKFGFKIIKEFEFLERPAVVLHLNISEATFEKDKSYRRVKFIKKLLVK